MTGFERKKEELIPHWIGGGDEEVDASKREVLSSCLDKNKCEQQAIWRLLSVSQRQVVQGVLYYSALHFFSSPGQQWDHLWSSCKKNPRNFCNTFCKFYSYHFISVYHFLTMDRCSVLTLGWTGSLTEITKNISLELVAGEGFDPPRLGATWRYSTSTLEILRMGNISSLMPTAGTRERDHSGAGCSQRAWLLLLYRCRWTISIFFFFVYSLCFLQSLLEEVWNQTWNFLF